MKQVIIKYSYRNVVKDNENFVLIKLTPENYSKAYENLSSFCRKYDSQQVILLQIESNSITSSYSKSYYSKLFDEDTLFSSTKFLSSSAWIDDEIIQGN